MECYARNRPGLVTAIPLDSATEDQLKTLLTVPAAKTPAESPSPRPPSGPQGINVTPTMTALSPKERELLTELRACNDDPKRAKALHSRLLREIVTSDEGMMRQKAEALYGDGWNIANDRAFGRAPQEITFEGSVGFRFELPADLSDDDMRALAFLSSAAAVYERLQEAKVDDDEGSIVDVSPRREISGTSDKMSYVNSDPVKAPVKRRLF